VPYRQAGAGTIHSPALKIARWPKSRASHVRTEGRKTAWMADAPIRDDTENLPGKRLDTTA